jgi:hypothetical protein
MFYYLNICLSRSTMNASVFNPEMREVVLHASITALPAAAGI